MYPDPRDIQTNLSGFLSFKNARIFTGELWKQLLNSMGSNDTKKSENQRITNDKIKSFPRLGPSENKQTSIDVFIQDKSFEKKESRHYRFTGSRSDTFSSRYNSRSRSRSNDKYKYRDDHKNRYKSRSRTKSSSRYTPYTRYSRYTESYGASSSSCSSISHYNSKRKSYSSSSSSSNSKSEMSVKSVSIKSTKELNGMCLSISPLSNIQSSPNKTSTPSVKDWEECLSKTSLNIHNCLSEIHENNSRDLSPTPPKKVFSIQNSPESTSSSSDSIAFVSPKNVQLHEMSSVSDTSSSEYSIEYMDKSLLVQSEQYISEDEFESDVEWITCEEYQKLKENESLSNASFSSSPTNSHSSSEYSFNDIEWVEEYELDRLSEDYLRI